MKMKRFLTAMLALCLVLTVLPMTADAVVSKLAEEGYWVVGAEDTSSLSNVQIIKYTGKASSVTIPTQVGRYTVKGIHNFAFKDNTTVKTITVPDGMNVGGLGGCNVVTVKLGKNVTLSAEAFANCEKLKNINIPEGTTAIPGNGFLNCTSLTTLSLPDSIEAVYSSAFEGCTALTSLTLPAAVESIGIGAFYGCVSLKTINIPANVEEIEYDAFAYCESLSAITVAAGNETFYNDSDGNLCQYVENQGLVSLVRGLSVGYGNSYTIPAGIDEIDRHAFSGAVGLKKVVIPETVIYIGHNAFADCTNLKEIRFEGKPYIYPTAFEGVTATVYYPGDTGEWDYFKPEDYDGNLTWEPYCTGIHKGRIGTVLEEATCAKTGRSENICELCGETYSYEIPMEDHTYDEGVVTREAICMTNGERTYTCIVCGDSYTRTIYAPGHHFDYANATVIEEPTCTEKGSQETYCVDCGAHWVGEIAALGHDYSEVVCAYDDSGYEHVWKCSRCDSSDKTEACTFESHVITEATLEEPGVMEYACTVCGGSYQAAYMYRIYGEDRCETARKAADELKKVLGIEKFDTIIIASGDAFADALAGSYLSAVKQAPILLHRDSQQSKNVEYIRNNLNAGGTVYILGGSDAVPGSVAAALNSYNVKRLGGMTRFETNVAILEEAGVSGGELLVCTGYEFADSLSASATGLPILLVHSGKTELNETQTEYLEKLNLSRITIIGGSSAVNEELAGELAEYGTVRRLGGTTRFETSVLVAKTFFEAPASVILAYGWNFPDGLCGGPLANALNAPLLLTESAEYEAAEAYVTGHGITKGAVLGGSILIGDEAVWEIFGLGENALLPGI